MGWRSPAARLARGRVVASTEADQDWLGMWRVKMPDGHLTDMVNRTRARDAALTLAAADLNMQETALEARTCALPSRSRLIFSQNESLAL